ncbi:hypothetical protein HKX48_006461 [Thoreauomyces humboldtii]|nr:hypothetical protein HKX48_006461 [Thoreauomyces humboldtii]
MSQQRDLTAGEECQQAAKTFSAFADAKQGAIPPAYITSAMGCAICKGSKGVAVLRLKTGEWSAPCAIELEQQNGTIQSGQETVLLFMTEKAIHKLVSRALLRLGVTDQFKPGPIHGREPIDPSVDVYGWVRFNGGFTPPELIASNMVTWFVREDPARHGRWHGESVTWFDVLTNKITVDRSSVGNALYIVLNLAAGSNAAVDVKRKNYANLDSLSDIAPSVTKVRAQQQQQQQQQQHQGAPQQQQQQPQQQYQPPLGSPGMYGVQANPQLAYQQQLYNMQGQQGQQFGQQQLDPQQLLMQQQQAYMYQLQQQQLYQQAQSMQFQQGQPSQQQQQQPAGQLSYEQMLQQQALAHQQYAQGVQGGGAGSSGTGGYNAGMGQQQQGQQQSGQQGYQHHPAHANQMGGWNNNNQ